MSGLGAGVAGARRTSAAGAGRRRAGLMIRWAKRLAISLRVSGICPAGPGLPASLGGGGDGQEGAGEHGEGDPAVPGGPAADLVLVQAGEAFAGLEVLLDGPPEPGDLDQRGEGNGLRGVAAVEGQFPGARVAADQQPAASRRAVADGDPGPVVVAVAFGAGSRRTAAARPAPGRRAASASARRVRPAPAGTR